MGNLTSNYNEYYKKRTGIHLYPVEFVLRTFVGTYPELKWDKTKYAGSKILDLGYGDGRNMPLFKNLLMEIHGVEISEEINRQAKERLSLLEIDAILKVGKTHNIPYENSYFDYLVACHSCYYIEGNNKFDTHVTEMARVLKPGGHLCLSIPMLDNFIFKDAIKLENGYMLIKNDHYGIRNETIHKAFENEKEIIDYFSPYFKEITIGFCNDNYYGINVKMWFIAAVKI